MTDQLQVVPERLHASANAVDRHLRDHLDAHKAADSKIAGAASGLVGVAAAALATKSTDLQAKSLHITNELTHFRDALDTCGYAFTTMDEESKVRIFNTRAHGGS
ncbi:WXG100 family type VII secretion target [Mycobacteroides abscessus]|uniref:WXG100 family type VII secretion target n=1 Tax=Mycobacteroides abscessus TaxID=36809 RepID=A0ABD7HQG5_9MYCO|nr:WXG100 family type VII secretion target [Mycobacteroides abscessus]RIQ98402.1 WXG100 family type VII secretion target [Mycobacteroides abscessus]RIR47749.1 WXG100 family type VII secretion target [Mycobacteroides abscessus]RIT40061.1 WXG100 family type VII secretion target [Mycobacteroides abscessus]